MMAAGTIRDTPRFAYRGAMLDVARHFFQVDDVKAYIDLLAHYKMNALHLHLTDDQGWRIMINSWPKLATYGGSTQVGGGKGGYYTQEQYADIVAFAQARYITIVPEIDLPGHTNSALASYAELNCDGVAPALYTETNVGFSSLCIDKDLTYQFLDDVIGELAALTPGPYLHIGGDEAHSTPKEDYVKFIEKVQAIVQAHGKQVMGWEEIGQVKLLPGTLAQYWNTNGPSTPFTQQAVLQGAKVIVSPADRAYLDMKYDAGTKLGLDWAGMTDTRASYGWDPAGRLLGVSEENILGVEAPLWSETLITLQDIEFMAFPRILGIAEIGWSPAGLSWDEYRERLAAQAPRLQALGVNYYPDPEVPWVETSPLED
jgi:hexosaminidase